MDRFLRYFLTGVGFWVAVDYTTAFNPDLGRWLSYMPMIWLFYLGSPLLFAYLIYRRGWGDRALLLPMFAVIFIVEIVFTGNSLLYTFPILLAMVPLAVSIYALITYVPRWMTDGSLKNHRMAISCMFIVWLAVAVLSFITRTRGP